MKRWFESIQPYINPTLLGRGLGFIKYKNSVLIGIFLIVIIFVFSYLHLNKVSYFKSEKDGIEIGRQVLAIRNISDQTISFLTTDGDTTTPPFKITCCSSDRYSSEDFQISPNFKYVVFGKKVDTYNQPNSQPSNLFIFFAHNKKFEQLPDEVANLEISTWSQDGRLLLLFKDRTFYVYDIDSKKIISKTYAGWTDELKYSLENLVDENNLLLSFKKENLNEKSFLSFNLNSATLEDTLLSKSLNQLQEQGYQFDTTDLVGNTYALSPDYSKLLITLKQDDRIDLHLVNLDSLHVQVVDTNVAKSNEPQREEFLGFGDLKFSQDGKVFYYKKLESYGEYIGRSLRRFMNGTYTIVTQTGRFDLSNQTPLGFISNDLLMVRDTSNVSSNSSIYSTSSIKDRKTNSFAKTSLE